MRRVSGEVDARELFGGDVEADQPLIAQQHHHRRGFGGLRPQRVREEEWWLREAESLADADRSPGLLLCRVDQQVRTAA
jgi:hypothetical protein